MTEINNKEFVEELLYSLGRKDAVKLKVLLQNAGGVDESTQRRMVFELSRSDDDDFALPLLAYLFAEKHLFPAQNQNLRQILMCKFIEKPAVLIAMLENPKISDKSVFISIAGEISSEASIPALMKILKSENDKALIVDIINALGDIASSEAANAITDYLYSRDRKVILAAIKALRKIASPVCIQRLAERMGTDTQIDILIIDALAEVQDQTALEKLNETLVSHYAVIRNYGKSKLVRIGPKAVPVLIGNLLYDDPDLLIHTLNVLGEIGDPSAIGAIRKLLYNEPKDPNVRFAAYETLGLLPVEKGSHILAAGLGDPVDNVCIAAAKAINKNYNDVLAAGIKNLLRDSGTDFKRIISIVIDAEADNIFIDMLGDEICVKYILAYLKNKAPVETQKHFETLLRQKGYSEIAAKISAQPQKPQSSNEIKIYVVDDSRMILTVYKTVLHRLGYAYELFEFPSAAIEKALSEKPDIMITDLNMPEITGIQVISELRKKYPPEALPIIMVTTQNEVQDNEAAFAAGVTHVMHKPFDDNSLGTAIKGALKKL